MKLGSNYQDKRSTRCEVLGGIEKYTEGVRGVQNEKEHLFYADEQQW